MISALRRKDILYPLLAAAVLIAFRLALLPVAPVPAPQIHDEFSYLLAADTFAHGRVTNPPHPHWEFFESFHILQQPTYMSMYPPMQGLTLALGQAMLGHPFWGVLLGSAAFCGLAAWMMQAWVPPGWALSAALLLGLAIGGTYYWTNSYWGGSVAGAGACLLFGSAARLGAQGFGRPTLQAILMAVGLVILANSRPWEGLLVSIGPVLFFVHWIFKSGYRTIGWRLIRVMLPWALILCASGTAMAYYCWRITGNPLQLPYALNRKTYAVAPVFVWESTNARPVYRHPVMERFYLEWEPSFQGANQMNGLRGWASVIGRRMSLSRNLTAALAALFLLAVIARPPRRWLLVAPLAVFILGTGLQRFMMSHYCAPAMPLVLAAPVLALRRSAAEQWRWRVASRRAAISLALLGAVALVAMNLRGIPSTSGFLKLRAEVLSRLEGVAGNHLVLVRYSSAHSPHEEWVYNGADLHGARIVWARFMNEQKNGELLRHYHGRVFWLLEPRETTFRLTRLPAPGTNASADRKGTGPSGG